MAHSVAGMPEKIIKEIVPKLFEQTIYVGRIKTFDI
jgi:hypothetical protein